MLRVSDLRHKDIINCVDGRRLGYIRDVDMDMAQGTVKAIIVPGEMRFFTFFSRNDDIVIPWEQIKKIGLDVILVELERITPTRRSLRRSEEQEEVVFSRLPSGAVTSPLDYDAELEQIMREQAQEAPKAGYQVHYQEPEQRN